MNKRAGAACDHAVDAGCGRRRRSGRGATIRRRAGRRRLCRRRIGQLVATGKRESLQEVLDLHDGQLAQIKLHAPEKHAELIAAYEAFSPSE